MFKTEAAFDAALAQNGQKLGSRYIDIKLPDGPKVLNQGQTREAIDSMPTDCVTLFVKGLPYSFKEDDIGDRFRRYGEIKAIRLAYNWQTKESKGFAYIQYATHDSAKEAMLKMNGKDIMGRQIRVDFDVRGK